MKIAIIGAGPGGYVAAIRAAQKGAEVVLVDKYKVGGTCLNYGCIPSKILKKTAEMLDSFSHCSEFGIDHGAGAKCNMAQLMKRKEQVIDTQAKGIHALLQKAKVTYVCGTAYFPKKNRLEVRSDDGSLSLYDWDKLILATGSSPSSIPSFPFDKTAVLSSDNLLDLTTIPQSITIVGAGVIGCEFAFIWNSLGADVTVIEALDRALPLPAVDRECSKIIAREMKKRKINLLVNKTVDSCTRSDSGLLQINTKLSPFCTKPSKKDAEEVIIESQKLAICIGRKPNSDTLGLDNIGVTTDARGWVVVDEKMQTSAENVYAIGDLLGPAKVMLAHVASTEAEVAVSNCFNDHREMVYDLVPGAIFTSPEIGTVGLSEEEAQKKHRNVRADSVLFRTSGKAQVLGELAGMAKIVSDGDSGKILGVHIAGPHATDLLGEASLAMQLGAKVEDLAHTIHAHPTLAEILMETSLKAINLPLHS
ncbi:dihydrolipoyl dehydrogenase [Desulforhopalus singaporensis]|uniref:Dihydrolipoyl dehydrogenase n=1 Tax=Desulforhopalus singaporensis TaxID=91360 RepID=A0A1H0PUV3_9BACT|nr:dihydrolipoyl dehydrogenase [Desulforhopalus singaporensis]SDP08288.1 dihydrolipoamide dehydrogenase [Desulforhopalus singaporensis]